MVLHRVHNQILRSHHLFEPLNDEQMDELMSSSQLLNLDKGDNLFHQASRHIPSISSFREPSRSIA